VAETIKGISIVIGAETTGLSAALSEVNKKSRDIQTELRQVEKLLKFDPKNTELLAQKQKLLGEAIQNSKSKLDGLKAAQEQVNQQFAKGEISEGQYRAFQREVAKAEQELSKFEKQLKDTGITADQVAKKLGDAGKKMTDMGKTLSMSVTAPIVAAGAASFKFAADLQDAMGASDQIFKDASGSIKSWADGLDSYYGIAEGEALEYANTMGAMLQNIGGLGEAEASKQAQTLVELAGDLTAMFGGTTESAVQALTGALKGNTSMLDNYGMGVNAATIKTKALEMGLHDGKGEMDLATKQAATLALIMEQTADAQGQAAREAEGASGATRAFQTELKNLATDIGEVLLPVLTPLMASLRDLIKRFGEMSPEMQKAIVIAAGLAAAIGPLLLLFGGMSSGVSAIIGVVTKLVPVIASATTAVGGLSGVIAFITGPIGIAIAAVAALIAVGVLLYKNWDEIKAFGLQLWTDLKTGWTEGMASIKVAWVEFGQTIKATWENMWNSIKTWYDQTKENLITATTNLTDGMITKWSNFKTGFMNIWTAIVGALKGYVNNIIGFINKLIDALNTIQVDIPSWVPIYGGNSFGIDIANVPYLATGGIVTRPTLAMIGEAGPEAVIPLNQMGPSIGTINIYGSNASEIWSKFERELNRRGVRI
jgi:phage-related minor tail protein